MQRENQLVRAGTYLPGFCALAFLPSLTGHELLILSWLGAWAVPIGISSMVVGAALWVAGKVQRRPEHVPRRAGPVGRSCSPRRRPPRGCRPGQPAAEPRSMPVVQPNVLSGQAAISPDPKRPR